MVGVVDGCRWAVLGTATPHLETLLVSLFSVCALLAGGLVFFKRMERRFADVI
jgi:lipopolysaccharide transport system permease protein